MSHDRRDCTRSVVGILGGAVCGGGASASGFKTVGRGAERDRTRAMMSDFYNKIKRLDEQHFTLHA